MPTDVAGLPLLPLIALIGGVLTLIKADLLNWIVALFLIGFGVLGILPALGIDLGVTTGDLQDQINQLRQPSDS
ncbi:MAG: DUF3096 domain-containing protein [Rhodobacteraceae bacterium]|nr:DUF3096 domain-containing protein [Paracoccaceae bacterium]